MSEMYLTNSLSRKKENFTAVNPPHVGMYSCGPTVYQFVSIGNFRTYLLTDILYRVLTFNGYQVDFIMNITDVGHLTGDNLGNADIGEDRIEKAARSEGKTAWDVAKYYTDIFLSDYEKLNLTKPRLFVKATDHIKEQIELIKEIEDRGFAYKISDGIYFDTELFEKKSGKKYGELSTLDVIASGVRVEENPEKKNPRDFALWKFSYPKGRNFNAFSDNTSHKRQMEWESPWGLGFPGWHIECSAMSMKYLGESFDIHVGGEDLRSTHHPNEIAQAESVTGKQFVKYWIHGTFLKVDGKRMGKSLGNVFTLADIENKGYDPLALRYLYLTSNYRDTLNFTWDSLKSAQTALNKLREHMVSLLSLRQRTMLSMEKGDKVDIYNKKFLEAINDDMDMPKAIAILWEVIKSNIPSEDKYDLAINFDEVLGLRFAEITNPKLQITKEVNKLIETREKLRSENKFEEADKIRKDLEKEGFYLIDSANGPVIRKNN